MSISLNKMVSMVQTMSNQVNAQLSVMQACGTNLSIPTMLTLQMYMNKFSQISDLASQTISLYNSAIKNSISALQRG